MEGKKEGLACFTGDYTLQFRLAYKYSFHSDCAGVTHKDNLEFRFIQCIVHGDVLEDSSGTGINSKCCHYL